MTPKTTSPTPTRDQSAKKTNRNRASKRSGDLKHVHPKNISMASPKPLQSLSRPEPITLTHSQQHPGPCCFVTRPPPRGRCQLIVAPSITQPHHTQLPTVLHSPQALPPFLCECDVSMLCSPPPISPERALSPSAPPLPSTQGSSRAGRPLYFRSLALYLKHPSSPHAIFPSCYYPTSAPSLSTVSLMSSKNIFLPIMFLKLLPFPAAHQGPPCPKSTSRSSVFMALDPK